MDILLKVRKVIGSLTVWHKIRKGFRLGKALQSTSILILDSLQAFLFGHVKKSFDTA